MWVLKSIFWYRLWGRKRIRHPLTRNHQINQPPRSDNNSWNDTIHQPRWNHETAVRDCIAYRESLQSRTQDRVCSNIAFYPLRRYIRTTLAAWNEGCSLDLPPMRKVHLPDHQKNHMQESKTVANLLHERVPENSPLGIETTTNTWFLH